MSTHEEGDAQYGSDVTEQTQRAADMLKLESGLLAQALFSCMWQGKTISVNQWHEATTKTVTKKGGLKRHQARLYQSPQYRRFKESVAISLRSHAKSQLFPSSSFFDLVVIAWLWRMKDTDGIEKPIGDALEMASIIENDRQIRHKFTFRHYHRKNEPDTLIIALIDASHDAHHIRIEQETGYGLGNE
jgi:Holliday junction resolvase RusA-like endonuclease